MALQIGIVGLPQVGKSTVFNALTALGAAAGHARPPSKPNIGVAPVPDERLKVINQFIKTERIVPATLQVLDVAGLVRGASTGEGLGNKFLAHLREVDAILHVVRCFVAPDVPHVEGSIDPLRDVDTVETELVLADLEVVSGALDKARRTARSGEKDAVARAAVYERAMGVLDQGKPVRQMELTPADEKHIRGLGLITARKTLYVANVDETDIHGQGETVQQVRRRAEAEGGAVVAICGKLEAEISELKPEDRGEMLQSMGLTEPALAVLAREAYKLLGLHSFFTAGPKEIKAWEIPIGTKAPQAAGVIHGDLERSFIKAEIYTLEDLKQHKTEVAIKGAGRMRLEGKEYVMRDGDITHFQAGLAGKK